AAAPARRAGPPASTPEARAPARSRSGGTAAYSRCAERPPPPRPRARSDRRRPAPPRRRPARCARAPGSCRSCGARAPAGWPPRHLLVAGGLAQLQHPHDGPAAVEEGPLPDRMAVLEGAALLDDALVGIGARAGVAEAAPVRTVVDAVALVGDLVAQLAALVVEARPGLARRLVVGLLVET